ncbi:MAG: hypothetical protein KBA51_02115 [Kiritimatiellae bacterium]|nr:hypothetical protein [Kiritimatiellia bacterium]
MAAIGFAALTPHSAPAQVQVDRAAIGYTALQNLLGSSMPTGAGLSATMGEALVPGYRLDVADAAFSGKTIVFPSGLPETISYHAVYVGKYFFGSTHSLAPDIGRTADGQDIANYSADNWIDSGFLNMMSGSLPSVESRDIMNHSWVGTTGDSAADTDILRRYDYAIARDDFVAVSSVNNRSTTTIPNLLSSSYNGIIAGRSDGNHSRGTTPVDGAGRIKPDIVAPMSFTSYSAPIIAGASGLLLETARTAQGLDNGDHSVVVKSIMLAGADREGSHVPFSWSHTSTSPMDSVYGAGQLNVYDNHLILTGGEFDADDDADAGSTGWDFGTGSAATEQLYFFDTSVPGAFSAALTWNRDITYELNGGLYEFTSSLANLDLRLYSAEGFVPGNAVWESMSTVDNVELIYQSSLSAGRYALGVTSNMTNVAYGLAWHSIPEPAAAATLALGFFALWARRRLPERAPHKRPSVPS